MDSKIKQAEVLIRESKLFPMEVKTQLLAKLPTCTDAQLDVIIREMLKGEEKNTEIEKKYLKNEIVFLKKLAENFEAIAKKGNHLINKAAEKITKKNEEKLAENLISKNGN